MMLKNIATLLTLSCASWMFPLLQVAEGASDSPQDVSSSERVSKNLDKLSPEELFSKSFMGLLTLSEDAERARVESELALACVLLSAERGLASAQSLLGKWHSRGFLVKKSKKEALKWYGKAASQGEEEAQAALRELKSKEISTQEAPQEQKSLDTYSPKEMHDGVYFLFLLKGDEPNPLLDDLMLAQFLLSAERGYAGAQATLGDCYMEGKLVEKDIREALNWYNKAASKGEPRAYTALGNYYLQQEDSSRAVKCFRQAAQKGDAEAQNMLGFCYAFGAGVQASHSEALKWYLKAAQQGYLKAQWNVGNCYRFGYGVSVNRAEAMKWLRMAAEKGYAAAQNDLAFCLYYDEKKTREALEWWVKAAEQSFPDAIYHLGNRFAEGSGVEKDTEMAQKLWRRAAELGSVQAEMKLQR